MTETATSYTSYFVSTMSIIIWRSGQLLLGLTTVVLAGLYFKQDSLLYHPEIGNMPRDPAKNPRGYRSPADYKIPFEDVQIICDDGVKVHAWLMFGSTSTSTSGMSTLPTIVFFHGNAGNIGFRLPNMVHMIRRLEVNILMVEYRGYGRSDSSVSPSEKGIKLDGQAALRFIQNHPKIDPTKIFMFGRSLGGAAAFATAQYAQKNENKDIIHPLKGVIVENTFTSIADMVDALMPLVAKVKSLVLAIGWNSLEIVPALECPILYLAGSDDEIVPHSHMLTLHKNTVKSSLNRLHVIKYGTHNESWTQGGEMYWEAFASFLAGALSITNTAHIVDSVDAGYPSPTTFKKEL